jgi:cation transport regulator ChaB
MVYNNIEGLPLELRNVLPEKGQAVFLEVFNNSYNKHKSEAQAFATAWSVIKGRFNKVDGKYVANSKDFTVPTLYSFSLSEPTTKVIMNADIEEIVMEAVLATDERNTEGKYFTTEELGQIAEQININGSTIPDTEHEVLQTLIKTYGHNYDKIRNELKNKKGIMKSIKAAVEDGKLWIQAVLDKRYKNHLEKFKGLSIEAVADADITGRLKNPMYLGFTFTNNPKLRNAQIAG